MMYCIRHTSPGVQNGLSIEGDPKGDKEERDLKNAKWEMKKVTCVLNIERKLILTGLIGIIRRGSIAQVVVAAMVSFLFFAAVVREQPFKGRRMNWIKSFSEVQVFLVPLMCVVVQTLGLPLS
jgi:hypothetical protein